MIYQIKEVSRNVHTIKMNYKADWEQWFLLSSDQHHDHPLCNEKMLIKHLDQALERNAGIFIFGDWICGMQAKHDKRGSKSDIKEEHNKGNYLDRLVKSEGKFLKKYAKNLCVYGRGNHEQSILKNKETDLVQRIVDEVGCPTFFSGGYGGWVKFLFERNSGGDRRSVNLKYRHSGGSLGTVSKGVLGVDRMAKDYPDADIIVTGDNHEEWQMTIKQERLSEQGVISLKEQIHIKLPTYKDEHNDGYSGWHTEGNKAPRPLGAMWLRFYNEQNQIKFETIRAK